MNIGVQKQKQLHLSSHHCAIIGMCVQIKDDINRYNVLVTNKMR